MTWESFIRLHVLHETESEPCNGKACLLVPGPIFPSGSDEIQELQMIVGEGLDRVIHGSREEVMKAWQEQEKAQAEAYPQPPDSPLPLNRRVRSSFK